VRLFAGSGMRRDVWARVIDRFAPAGVLEFFASTEVPAVLANASGEKIGALGRPMPGGCELARAAYDFSNGAIARGRDGHCLYAAVDQPGVLLAQFEPDVGDERVMRDVFEPGDAWYATGDLLARDADGDYWYVDRLSELIDTGAGKVGPRAIEDAVYRLPEVRLAAAYGVPRANGGADVACAVVLRDDVRLGSDALREAVAELPREARPHDLRVVDADAIPMTDGFRPLRSRIQ
jgi:putative long chain acyl-CoA synthase